MWTIEDCNTALDDVAEELLQQGGVLAPPVDVLELARRLKIEIAFDDRQRARGRQKKLNGRPIIFLRPDDRPERLQWAAAHELGEVVAYRVLRSFEDQAPLTYREETANLFASRLLLPSCWFASDADLLHADLLQLKQVYWTASHELIAFRLLDFYEQSITTLFDQGRLTRRRGNGANRPPRLLPVEHTCWIEVHHRNRPVELHEQGVHVQGWPIHEAGWKREVLRTTTTTIDQWEPDDCW